MCDDNALVYNGRWTLRGSPVLSLKLGSFCFNFQLKLTGLLLACLPLLCMAQRRGFCTENWPQHLLTSGKFCCGVSDLCIMWKYYIARQRRKYHQHACMYIYIHNSTLLLHFHNRATRNYNCSPITLLCEV